MPYSKTREITKSEMKSAYDGGYSLRIACGNNQNDQITDSNTEIWSGTGTIPSYSFRKAWLVPRTMSVGEGSTLEEMLEYMDEQGLAKGEIKISNPSEDKIVSVNTGAEIMIGTRSHDNWWDEPPK